MGGRGAGLGQSQPSIAAQLIPLPAGRAGRGGRATRTGRNTAGGNRVAHIAHHMQPANCKYIVKLREEDERGGGYAWNNGNRDPK